MSELISYFHHVQYCPYRREREREKYRTIKREQLSIEWELGIGDDEYIAGVVNYAAPEIPDSSASTLKGKFLSDPKFAFTLAYTKGTLAS